MCKRIFAWVTGWKTFGPSQFRFSVLTAFPVTSIKFTLGHKTWCSLAKIRTKLPRKRKTPLFVRVLTFVSQTTRCNWKLLHWEYHFYRSQVNIWCRYTHTWLSLLLTTRDAVVDSSTMSSYFGILSAQAHEKLKIMFRSNMRQIMDAGHQTWVMGVDTHRKRRFLLRSGKRRKSPCVGGHWMVLQKRNGKGRRHNICFCVCLHVGAKSLHSEDF